MSEEEEMIRLVYVPWLGPPHDSGDEQQPEEEIPDPPKCPDCGGTGHVTLFSTSEKCERCGGSGY